MGTYWTLAALAVPPVFMGYSVKLHRVLRGQILFCGCLRVHKPWTAARSQRLRLGDEWRTGIVCTFCGSQLWFFTLIVKPKETPLSRSHSFRGRKGSVGRALLAWALLPPVRQEAGLECEAVV